MHWTESMAEVIVQLRAIYLSADFEANWAFHIANDSERLYSQGRWTGGRKGATPSRSSLPFL